MTAWASAGTFTPLSRISTTFTSLPWGLTESTFPTFTPRIRRSDPA